MHTFECIADWAEWQRNSNKKYFQWFGVRMILFAEIRYTSFKTNMYSKKDSNDDAENQFDYEHYYFSHIRLYYHNYVNLSI